VRNKHTNETDQSFRSVRLKWILQGLESGRREKGNTEELQDGIFSVGGEHISWGGGWNLDNPRYITREFYLNMSTGKIRPKDILLVKDGATIGKAAIASPIPMGEAAVNEHVFILRVTDANDPRYYFYVVQSPLFQEHIWLEVKGSAQPGLNSEFRGKVYVPNPDKLIQKFIVDYLDHELKQIDDLITAKERLLVLLAEKRQALITRAVTRGLEPGVPLRDSGMPWLGEIPVHWDLNLAKFLFYQASLPVRDIDEIVTCFRDGQVTLRSNRREEGFTNADLEVGYQGIRVGQLVLHSMDAFAGAIGVSDSDGKCSPEYIICNPVSSNTNNFYYALLLRTMALAGFIQASCPAVRERAPRIRFSNFGEMHLPLPPPNEQNEIAEYIKSKTSKSDKLSVATERTIALLKERRAAIIAAAVTGQIDVGGTA